MIDRDEVEAKSEEFGVHTSNLQRDYIFGWLLSEIYQNTYLKSLLILKGGNAFRKGYFSETRFSSDLDFSTKIKIDPERFLKEIQNCCSSIQVQTGVTFDTDRIDIQQDRFISKETSIHKARVYFDDFYGEKSSMIISVRLDVTEFDKLLIPEVSRPLIHPYSDAKGCQADIRCMALEELLANKLKCLIQRRHSNDLYDLVYSAFFDHAFDINRSMLVTTFLKKTIYDRSPGSAKQILLGIPKPFFKAAWNKYIVCPVNSTIEFDTAFLTFQSFINELFEIVGGRVDHSLSFYPAEMRNKVLDAGTAKNLLKMSYGGVERIIEPYSLAFKRRKDGVAQEYFYGYDRTGGHNSGPSIKAFMNYKVQSLEVLDEKFEPQYEVELAKAGDADRKGHFQKKFGRRSSKFRATRSAMPRSATRTRRTTIGASSFGIKHIIQCPMCQKKFTRKDQNTKLNKHKNQFGYDCQARMGIYLGPKF